MRLGLAVLFLTCAAAPALAYTQDTNPKGVPIAMPAGECEVVLATLPIGSSFDRPTLERAVDEAIAAWSAVSGLPVRLRRVATPTAGRPVITISDSDVVWAAAERYLALTTVSSHEHSGVIVSAVIDLDDVHHRFADVETDGGLPSDAPRHDLASVITHELGHTLGLGHSTDPAAVMYPDIAAEETRARTLSEDDRAGIVAIYRGLAEVPADAPADSQPAAASSQAPTQTGSSGNGCSMAPPPSPMRVPPILVLFLLAVVVVRARA